jgi:hypothetical protein
MSEMGQGATSRFVRAESALASTPDIGEPDCHVSVVPIVLQKSKVAGLRIFRENTKREAIADSYNLIRVSEVAYEFNTRR